MVDSGSKDVLSRNQAVPLWYPWAEFFKGKNNMAARYLKVKYIFLTNEAGTSVIPHFHVILTGQSVSCILFMVKSQF